MVKIDKEKCIGCGLCESIDSEVFAMKNGKAFVKNQKGNQAKIKDAIDSCPVQAISE
jgi:ferredoxin